MGDLECVPAATRGEGVRRTRAHPVFRGRLGSLFQSLGRRKYKTASPKAPPARGDGKAPTRLVNAYLNPELAVAIVASEAHTAIATALTAPRSAPQFQRQELSEPGFLAAGCGDPESYPGSHSRRRLAGPPPESYPGSKTRRPSLKGRLLWPRALLALIDVQSHA